MLYKVKLKCTLVQALRLCAGRTAHRGSRCIALLFLDHDTRRAWVVSVTPRPLFTPGKYPLSIVQEAGWAPGPVSPLQRFDPRTVQSVARRYIDYATRPNCMLYTSHQILSLQSNQEEWNGWSMWHAWGREEVNSGCRCGDLMDDQGVDGRIILK